MQAYKTYARVQPSGDLALGHLPFAPGSLVEVLVVGSERNAAEREQEWSRLMQTVQSLPQAATISDAESVIPILRRKSMRPGPHEGGYRLPDYRR